MRRLVYKDDPQHVSAVVSKQGKRTDRAGVKIQDDYAQNKTKKKEKKRKKKKK